MTGTTNANLDPDGSQHLLTEILAEARGDDEHLRALHRVFADAFELPADVHIVGEPLVLVAVEYEGNARRGLVARVRREDGTEVGTAIGELSVRDSFDGVLPWGLVGNRPILSCLASNGSCLWRLGRWDEAERMFERVLRLDPTDHQDVRLWLSAVRARDPWTDDEVWR